MLTDTIQQDVNSNSIKGGLIGLASCGIGGGTDIINYISFLLPPILDCFDNEDTRIRFYACESLYNIVKAARGGILTFINEIFSSLCELYADVDVEVKEISCIATAYTSFTLGRIPARQAAEGDCHGDAVLRRGKADSADGAVHKRYESAYPSAAHFVD